MTLDELIHQIAKGDRQAFATFFDHQYHGLVRFIQGNFPALDEGEAESVIMDVMMRVWEKAGTFRGTGEREAAGWLHTIARHRALEYLDTRHQFDELDENLPEKGGEDAFDWDALLAMLTLRQRQVLAGLYRGMKSKEIAAKLGIAEPRVTQIIQDIRRKAERLRG